MQGPVGCRARAWCGRLPSSSGCWRAGPTQTPFWETCFPARLPVPSPSAPEAFILGTLTGGLQMKRENNNKKVHFLTHLQIPTAQGSECKTLISWPLLPPARGGQDKKNKTVQTTIKAPSCFLAVPVCSLCKRGVGGGGKETWYLNQCARQFAFIWFALHLHE